MVSEKIAAAAASQAAAAAALTAGKGIETAASVALAPVKRAVRAIIGDCLVPSGSIRLCRTCAGCCRARLADTDRTIVPMGVVTDAAGLPRRFAWASTSV
jgi:hypothetical protein